MNWTKTAPLILNASKFKNQFESIKNLKALPHSQPMPMHPFVDIKD